MALVSAQLAGCGLFKSTLNAPGNIANSMMAGSSKATPRVPPSVLQANVMRFADTFSSAIVQASQSFATKAATPEAEIQAKSWIIGQTTSALTIASGPNANVSLVDMVVLVTLGRMTHEEYFLPKVWGEADRPMVEAFIQLEADILEIAGKALTEQQIKDLKATIRAWRDQNPDMGGTAYVRLPVFEVLLAATKQQATKASGGLGDMLTLDPLSGLDPAVREIEQTRLLAERGMYYAQRLPLVLSMQVELMTLKFARRPEVQSALADTERVSQAASSLAATAASLPEAVRVEREAAVTQIAAEITAQRQGLVADIEKIQAPAREVLTQARSAIDAGTQMSVALQGTIQSFDTLMSHLNPREPPGAAPKPKPTEPSKPFDVSEYGEAVTRIGAAAHELTSLVTTLDKSMPQVQRVLDESVQRADRTVDRALDRALMYGAILILAIALAVLLVRWVSHRCLGRGSVRSAT